MWYLTLLFLTISPLTPEQDFTQISICGEKPSEPLSISLKNLMHGICNDYFKEDFFRSIAKLEKEKFDGEYAPKWDNGQVKLRATFVKGKVEGHVHGWYPDGQEAFKAFYEKERKLGIHLAFFPLEIAAQKSDPIARLLIYNEKGQLHGEQLNKWANGRLKDLVTYKKGHLDGIKCWYTEEGKGVGDLVFSRGKLIENKGPKEPRKHTPST